MDFIINESQLRKILLESDESRMSDDMRILYSYTKNLILKAKKTYGFNLQLLLTWGASVGGLVMPLDAFIRTGRFDLTEAQQTLILVGIACTYFYDNSKMLKSIVEQIKEEDKPPCTGPYDHIWSSKRGGYCVMCGLIIGPRPLGFSPRSSAVPRTRRAASG